MSAEMRMPVQTVGVIGAGSWGTALAQVAARAGRETLVWARDPALAEALSRDRCNTLYLPHVGLVPEIRATADLGLLAATADLLVLAVPAQATREVLDLLPASSVPIVLTAKGFDAATARLLSEVAAEVRPDAPTAVLTGPSFAEDVALGRPTAVTLACADNALGEALAPAVGDRLFRVYWTDDLIGVQVGGAVKNVLAIAAGVVEGRGLGHSARAAMVTRGLAEMVRLGLAMGARRETLMGLSGLGDLVLTTTSMASRNMSLGHALGHGGDLAHLLAARRTVTEGVHTAGAVMRLADQHGVEMPITAAVDAVVAGRQSIDAMIGQLLDRPLRAEA